MIYDKGLKGKVEPLALKYYNLKNNISDTEKSRLEDEIVKAVEDYVFLGVLFNRPTHIMADVKQAARIGIVNAIRSFDPTKGSFCTWVIWQVKDTVNRDTAGHWIKVPAYMGDNARKLARLEAYWVENTGRLPSDDEVIEQLGWSRRILKRTRHVLSLQNSSLIDNRAEENIGMGDKSNMKIDIRRAIDNLEPRQRQVVQMYFNKELDMVEIASKLGISPQRVQEILRDAYKILAPVLKDYS